MIYQFNYYGGERRKKMGATVSFEIGSRVEHIIVIQEMSLDFI